jgi:hypothetical protein
LAVHRSVDAIISVARSTTAYYRDRSYPGEKIHHIPNGIDPEEYYPDLCSGRALREALGIGIDAPVVGMAGRWSFEKGFETFIGAADRLLATTPNARFLLCGPGVVPGNRRLMGLIAQTRRPDRFSLLGYREAMRAFYSALDIYTACPRALESFGLTAVEAMACGVPPVVTDVGDLRYSVGPCGEVIPHSDPCALAAAWQRLLTRVGGGRAHDPGPIRAHVIENFSLNMMVISYEALYNIVMSNEDSVAPAALRSGREAPAGEWVRGGPAGEVSVTPPAAPTLAAVAAGHSPTHADREHQTRTPARPSPISATDLDESPADLADRPVGYYSDGSPRPAHRAISAFEMNRRH